MVTGSSTVAPLVAEIAKRFETLHPAVRVDVQTGGSGKGISDARIGMADIGMASRALKDGEMDLRSHPIAADGVGLIVHQSNSIKTLTSEQVIAIYSDRINNWMDVGGAERAITVVHKAEGRATLEVFLEHFGVENPNVKPDVIVGDNEHGVKTVAGSLGAIGYVSIGAAEADMQQGVPIRLLPLDGVEATTANVASGQFPMSRPLNLVTGGTPSDLAKEFVRFCQSPEVHDLVKSQFFVPLVAIDLPKAIKRANELGFNHKPTPRMFIIRNSKFSPVRESVDRNLVKVATRAIESMVQSMGRSDLNQIYAISKARGTDFHYTEVPEDFFWQASSKFDGGEMQRLYDVGYERAQGEDLWSSEPPGLFARNIE